MTGPLTTEQKMRMTAVAAGFLLLFTVNMAVANLRDLHKSSFTAVQATILSTKQRTGFSKVSKASVPKLLTDIEYQYRVGDKDFKATETSEWISDLQAADQYAGGKRLTVYVNPADPTEVSMNGSHFAASDVIGTALFGIAFLIAVGRCVVLFRRRHETSTA